MTPEQKVQGLMKPRYKVIADYPGNTNEGMEVGKVITIDYYLENNIAFLEKYPHLFQKLEWWQEREVSEMPEYVKLINTKPSYQLLNGCIRLVTEWNKGIHDTWICDTFPVYIHVSNLEPATKEEYDNYIQSKK